MMSVTCLTHHNRDAVTRSQKGCTRVEGKSEEAEHLPRLALLIESRAYTKDA
jgi:hypothetical protein